MYTDLDGFKTINDTYGHDVGDEVLVLVARRMAKLSRSEDVVARIGGDEFALVIADADAALLSAVAGRIDQAIAQPMMIGGRTVEISSSSGVAMSSAPHDDPCDLVRLADLSMLARKRSSRPPAVP